MTNITVTGHGTTKINLHTNGSPVTLNVNDAQEGAVTLNVTGSGPTMHAVNAGETPNINLPTAPKVNFNVSDQSSDLTIKTGVPQPPVAGPPGVTKDVVVGLDAQTEFIGVWSIQESGSDETTWPGRLMVLFNKMTDEPVATFVLDEFGQPRATSAKENTVALKLYGKQYTDSDEHEAAIPVFAIYDNQEDENIVFAVYPDGTVFCKEVTTPL